MAVVTCTRCEANQRPATNLAATGRSVAVSWMRDGSTFTRVELRCLNCKGAFWSCLKPAIALFRAWQQETACETKN